MALVCPKCGAQNPDANAFCQQCGSSLATAAQAPAIPPAIPPAVPPGQPPAGPGAPATPAAVPPSTAPPTGGPPTAPSPPATAAVPVTAAAPPPLPPTPPPHAPARLSRNAIIAIAVVVLVVIAGAVIAFAAIKHGPNPPPTPTSPPKPPTAPPSSAPSGTPRPTTPPTTPPQPGGQTLDAGFAAIPVPSGTTVANKSQGSVEIDVDNAKAGQFFFDAIQPPSGVTDTNSLLAEQLSGFQNSQGNTAVDWCPNGGAPTPAQLAGDSGAISAADGLICGTATTQNGQSYQFIAEVIGAYVNGANGPEAIVFTFYSTPDLFTPQQQRFESAILHGLVWHGVAS